MKWKLFHETLKSFFIKRFYHLWFGKTGYDCSCMRHSISFHRTSHASVHNRESITGVRRTSSKEAQKYTFYIQEKIFRGDLVRMRVYCMMLSYDMLLLTCLSCFLNKQGQIHGIMCSETPLREKALWTRWTDRRTDPLIEVVRST